MPDKFSTETRSRIMSRIRGKDTAPERLLRRILWRNGYRYRKNYPIGRYRIDIAFVSKKKAIYIDGCFWHGCPRHYRAPKSNKTYWIPKINRNKRRDILVKKNLSSIGWTVKRIWAHDIDSDSTKYIDKIMSFINN